MLRCEICDHTFEHGSDYRNSAPDEPVRYSRPFQGNFCVSCLADMHTNLHELKRDEPIKDGEWPLLDDDSFR